MFKVENLSVYSHSPLLAVAWKHVILAGISNLVMQSYKHTPE